MVDVTKRIMSHLGINPDRLLLEWVSAAEAARFAQVVTTLTNKIKELGPLSNDAKKGMDELTFKLQAAKKAVSGEKLRWVAAKQTEFMTDGNRYKEVFTSHESGRYLDGVILEEITVQEILAHLENGSLSVRDLSRKLGATTPDTLRHMLALLRKKMVKISEVKERSPIYSVCNNEA